MGRRFNPPTRNGGAKSATIDGPGSNGFWKRAVFMEVGTFNWVAPADGTIKIQALGAGAGGQNRIPGPSGAYGEKLLSVVRGQVLTVVVGAGSNGTTANTTASAQAGTTSISGDPVGPTALVLVGAKGAAAIGDMVPGFGTGPWDTTNPGARPISQDTGGVSSGSPFRAGQASTGGGGAGWARGAASVTGAPSVEGVRSRHYLQPAATLFEVGAAYWDFMSAENNGSGSTTLFGGVGAGGSSGNPPSRSLIGGGTGQCTGANLSISGHGAGGCAVLNNGAEGGPGGPGIVIIFFDDGRP